MISCATSVSKATRTSPLQAPRRTRLHGIANVSDPSDQIVVHTLSCFSSVCCILEIEAAKNNTWMLGPNDIEAHLVFFSTCEELK